jgi:zinc transport system substrate-binding protein
MPNNGKGFWKNIFFESSFIAPKIPSGRGKSMTVKIAIRTIWHFGICFTFLLLWPSLTVAGESESMPPGKQIKVFVSIAPQAYLVERVGGDHVDVSIMVGPGQSPATYEPRPKQMAGLGRTALYFRIGVPFENVWMQRISKANPQMEVVDTRHGISLLSMKSHGHHDDGVIHGEKTPARGLKDPHIWLSLKLAKVQSKSIYDALIKKDPLHKNDYQKSLEALHQELDELDTTITHTLQDLKGRSFMAFHPAWGYFAQDYGLEQIPIEMEGKEPSAKSLAKLIRQAKEEDIQVIVVQKQFSEKSARAVARAIGGRVITLDPLGKNYLDNIKKIADAFAEALR